MGTGSILIVSGPSGSGKTSLVRSLIKSSPDIVVSISTTTRQLRKSEKSGSSYIFVSSEKFKKLIKEGYFLEWAIVHGNYYGTSANWVKNTINSGKLIIFEIDVQGFMILKRKFHGAITSVFITTKSLDILKERLSKREMREEIIKQRVENAYSELKYLKAYDFVLINKTFKDSLEKLMYIAKVAHFKKSDSFKEKFLLNWSK